MLNCKIKILNRKLGSNCFSNNKFYETFRGNFSNLSIKKRLSLQQVVHTQIIEV